jgi:hypothetical protein
VTAVAAFGIATNSIATYKKELAHLDKSGKSANNNTEATAWAVFDTSAKFLVRPAMCHLAVEMGGVALLMGLLCGFI